MKQDDYVRMAGESGMDVYGLGKNREKFIYYITAFAALVAAAEREECAKIAEVAEPYQSADLIRARGNP